ncbi:hypothetical protein O181_022563 [Austropuccinia psidii MF-1]|uniref:Integrase catalytic domain-containing protein n=1 Tax=Austropuccinia psidii MF-1 TaxID=1389203 RepID=A0A9Q3CH43_9BASI|nr:hypothetical protein [Austropuccinia psidii MF-1]
MIQIWEPKTQLEIVYMDWLSSLPPGGVRSFHDCLVLVDRYSKSPMFLPCNKDSKDVDTSIIIYNKVISHTGLFQNTMNDRDLQFTSALWENLHNLFGTKLSFSEAYHPQTNDLAERMTQKLEDIIRIFCAYGL